MLHVVHLAILHKNLQAYVATCTTFNPRSCTSVSEMPRMYTWKCVTYTAFKRRRKYRVTFRGDKCMNTAQYHSPTGLRVKSMQGRGGPYPSSDRRRFRTGAVWVRSRVRSREIYGGQWRWGDSPRTFLSPASSHSTNSTTLVCHHPGLVQ
jgi:hypothetical protein